jgi:POT family proton-dependent oligopeptide transporter
MHKGPSQPQGFATLFLTEMWERYGFYILQTLLVFYLLDSFHFSDHSAYLVVGSFTALAYINSLFGGLIADKLIGYVNTLFLGGVLLLGGYFLLGVTVSAKFLYFGLSAITIGTGLLKPNVSSMIGTLYAKHDVAKDAGYTTYYMGIYIGALSGSFLGGYFHEHLGWAITFYSAAFGMTCALLIFSFGKVKYNLRDTRKRQIPLSKYILAAISVAMIYLVSFVTFYTEGFALAYFAAIGLFCIFYLLYAIFTHHGAQRRRLIAFSILVILAVGYWGIYFQQFLSIGLATARTCKLFMPASSYPSVESLGIILFGPVINWIWYTLAKSKKNLSIPAKFSLGFLFNSICFLLLTGGLGWAIKTGSYFNAIFIVIGYLLVAIGELCISPTSLSMVSTLVPEELTSAMMGISLLSIGFGGKLAGLLANNAILDPNRNSLISMQKIYMHTFFTFFVISLVIFVVTLILTKYIRKLIHT